MSRVVTVFLIFLASQKALSVCEVKAGTYEAITESEYSLTLNLEEDGLFFFTWENWIPGESEISEKHIYKGYWTCSGAKAIFEYSEGTVEAEYKKLSLPKSFTIDKSAYILSVNRSEGFRISGWEYWPAKFLREAFQ